MFTFFTKTVPSPIIISICAGITAGAAFGLSVPMLVGSHSERVATYEEVSAQYMIEDAMRIAGRSSSEQAGFMYVTRPGIQKYDGPRLAESMPIETKEAWLSWMSRNRNDEPRFLEARWQWAEDLINSTEQKRPEDVKAFLLTPREHFVRAMNRGDE